MLPFVLHDIFAYVSNVLLHLCSLDVFCFVIAPALHEFLTALVNVVVDRAPIGLLVREQWVAFIFIL